MAKDADVKTSDKDLKDSLEFFTTTSEEQAKAAEEAAKKLKKMLQKKILKTKQKILTRNLNKLETSVNIYNKKKHLTFQMLLLCC